MPPGRAVTGRAGERVPPPAPGHWLCMALPWGGAAGQGPPVAAESRGGGGDVFLGALSAAAAAEEAGGCLAAQEPANRLGTIPPLAHGCTSSPGQCWWLEAVSTQRATRGEAERLPRAGSLQSGPRKPPHCSCRRGKGWECGVGVSHAPPAGSNVFCAAGNGGACSGTVQARPLRRLGSSALWALSLRKP